mgnify:CR=1 FL=1
MELKIDGRHLYLVQAHASQLTLCGLRLATVFGVAVPGIFHEIPYLDF